jgi:peptide/nickel transport system permease protein
MWNYVIRRLLLSVLIMWGVLTLVFFAMHCLPGDPVASMLSASGASAERVAALREQLGLDRPLHVQYVQFLWGAVRGDFGRSLVSGRPVIEMVTEQLMATVQLALAGMLIAIVVGVSAGVASAVYNASWLRSATMVFATLGVSMPSFWFGLIMIQLFSIRLGWLPATGQGGLERLVMPASVLGLTASAAIARLVRSSVLEVLHQEYVTTARSKGLKERVVIGKHVLRNALIPTVTMIGLQLGWLLGGTVVVETIFSRQGIGRLAVGAVLHNDFPLVQGTVLFSAAFYLAANLAVDVLYAFLDPRVSYTESHA